MAIKIIPKEMADLMYHNERLTYNWGVEKDYHDTARELVEELPDEQAAALAELFDPWMPDVDVAAGQRLLYEDKLYKVVQAHHTQEDWTPDKTPALFVEIPKPGEIPVWRQPTGAQDAYMTGDKVHFPEAADPVYMSNCDNNVWAPNVYGWELVSE